MIQYLSRKNMYFLFNYETDLLNRIELLLKEGSYDDLEAENDRMNFEDYFGRNDELDESCCGL